MSYCRFGWGKSEVYVFFNEEYKYECCACSLFNNKSFCCDTPDEMVAHLLEHKEKGHFVPHYAFDKLRDKADELKKTNKTKK